MHPLTSSRTSERSERDPGPITTNVSVAGSWGNGPLYNRHRWLWVPAFAGTTQRGSCSSASCRLLAIGQMHRAVAPLRMRRQFIGCDIVGWHGRCRRQRRHRLLDAAILRRLILRRDVIQDRRQPALGLRDVPDFSRSVVFHLVALDPADAEVKTFRMAEIKSG